MTRLPPIGEAREDADDAQPESMSLMGGIAGTEDEQIAAIDAASAGGSRKIWSNGVVLIALVAAVAGGTLYAMRLTQDDLAGSATPSQVESKIEMYLVKLTNPAALAENDPLQKEQIEALFKDTDEAIRMLATDPAKKQVPVEYVKKNPFALRIVRQTAEGPVDNSKEEMERLARQRALEQEIKRLVLQSVSSMRVPVATINGEFYRTGDVIGSFTVDAISAEHQAVKLTAEGLAFVLRMEEQLNSGNRR